MDLQNVQPNRRLQKKAYSYKREMYNKTMHYQKIFGFETTEDPKERTHNNESDAFKHTFMSAVLSIRYGDAISKNQGNNHEKENLKAGNPVNESNMDYWNNEVGREIAKQVKQDLKGYKGTFTNKHIEDMVAQKVMQRMQKGDLITHPSDTRQFKDYKKIMKQGQTTGQAVPVQDVYTPQQIGAMSSEEFKQNESAIMEQLKQGLIQPQSEADKNLADFVNPETGGSKIYSREDIAAMSTKEYAAAEKEINAQMNEIGVPTKAELEKSVQAGDMVFVNSYSRADGTEVKGYYRARPI